MRLRFPEVPAERVDALVREEYAALTGPIRSYVPILVEKAVLARLRGETAGQATFTLSAGPG